MKQKRNKMEQKERVVAEAKKRLESMKEKVEVDSDPTRLYQVTETWKNRLSTPRSESTDHLTPRAAPRLGVPSWRKGV